MRIINEDKLIQIFCIIDGACIEYQKLFNIMNRQQKM